MKSRDTYATATGFVDLTVYVGTPRFVLHGRPCTAPFDLLCGRVVSRQGVAYACLAGWGAEHVLMSDEGATGRELCRVPHGGRGACALWVAADGVEIHAQGTNEDGTHTTITVYDERGTPIRTYRAHYGSMGILRVTGPNTLHSSADAIRHGPVIPWWTWIEVEGWGAGQTTKVPPGGKTGSYGLISPSGEVTIAAATPTWSCLTNTAAYLAVRNGVPRLALQDPGPRAEDQTPDPDAIQWLPLSACRDESELADPPPAEPPLPVEPPPDVPDVPAPEPDVPPAPPLPPVPAVPTSTRIAELADAVLLELLPRFLIPPAAYRRRYRELLAEKVKAEPGWPTS